MKKLFLLATLFVSTVCNAQVILWDGTDKEVGSDGGFWNRALPTVVEEDGNNVMEFMLKESTSGWDREHVNFGLPLGDVDFKGLRRLTLRIKMSKQHNVQVRIVNDGKSVGYPFSRYAWCGNVDEWNILVFEFAEGPDADQLVDTGNTVLEIWPFEDSGDALANGGEFVYVDDIKLEGPMVNGKSILSYEDNSLTGEVTIAGVIGKGKYNNSWVNPWKEQFYDDYTLVAQKLAPTATKLIVKDAARWDEDWTAIKAKCPNIEIVTDTDATAIGAPILKHEEDGKIYDLQGRQIAKPSQGIYIMNGKKYVR